MIVAYGSGSPAIHVGIHFGKVIQARKDIFGDAVNVAARMPALAKRGEIVVSKDLAGVLPDRVRLALLGKQMLKGKQESFEVYAIVLYEGAVTQMLRGSGAAEIDDPTPTLMPSIVVELTYAEQSVSVRDGECCLIGRVSREHAWIDVRAGRAVLTDQSSTGSWVINLDGAHTTLRRQAGTLGQRGIIRLELCPRDPHPAPEIEFALQIIV